MSGAALVMLEATAVERRGRITHGCLGLYDDQCEAALLHTLARVRRLADELDLPVALHLHETAVEIEQSLQAFGKRPLARLAALGLASPQLVAIHMTQVQPEDLDVLAEAGASVVHCPESNLKLGAGGR